MAKTPVLAILSAIVLNVAFSTKKNDDSSTENFLWVIIGSVFWKQKIVTWIPVFFIASDMVYLNRPLLTHLCLMEFCTLTNWKNTFQI